MMSTRTKIGSGGRIVIPAKMRRSLGLAEGDDVIVRVEDGELRITSAHEAIRRAQELVRQYVPAERSLVAELIAERRDEAARE